MSKQKYPTASTAVTTSTTGDSKGVSKRDKVAGYHSEKLHAARDKKRQEAKSRQRHESLTIKQRIALAQSRRGNSEKEQNRLFDLLDVKPAAAPVKVVNPQPVVVAVTERKLVRVTLLRRRRHNVQVNRKTYETKNWSNPVAQPWNLR